MDDLQLIMSLVSVYETGFVLFVTILTIRYIESISCCIKTNTTNSEYVIVYKDFIQDSHLSTLISLEHIIYFLSSLKVLCVCHGNKIYLKKNYMNK